MLVGRNGPRQDLGRGESGRSECFAEIPVLEVAALPDDTEVDLSEVKKPGMDFVPVLRFRLVRQDIP